MSRIGKLPVAIPEGVTATITGQKVTIKGKKGELSFTAHPNVTVTMDGKTILVTVKNEGKKNKALHGTTRAVINNMVQGLVNGYEKKLEVKGVGFRFQITPKKVTFSLGFSHPIEFTIPPGITMATDEENKNLIIVRGADKQLVGEVAARLRGLREPEPYKGKGIRYFGEHIVMKQGKKAAK